MTILGDIKMNEEKTRFSAKIEHNRLKFEKLYSDFKQHDDPVYRYIKRQQMKELKVWFEELGIDVEVP